MHDGSVAFEVEVPLCTCESDSAPLSVQKEFFSHTILTSNCMFWNLFLLSSLVFIMRSTHAFLFFFFPNHFKPLNKIATFYETFFF